MLDTCSTRERQVRLSIVIPAYNSETSLRKLLESLKGQIAGETEVLVVDDCSTDGTAGIAGSYPFVRLIQLDRNGGPARARNEGVRRATGEIIWFLDADTFLPEKTLEYLMAQHDKYPNALGIQGCYMVAPANPSFGTWYKSLTTAHWFHGSKVGTTHVLETCNGSVDREAFLKAGGFDEGYTGADVEDYEFGYRLTETEGALLLDPELRVYHHFPGIVQNLRNYAKRGYMWTKLFLRRGRFDEAAATGNEALARATGALFLLSLIVALVISAISNAPSWIWLFPVLVGAGYVAANRRLFRRFLEARGGFFLLGAVFVHLIESTTVLAAAALAMLLSPRAFAERVLGWLRQHWIQWLMRARLFTRLAKSVMDTTNPGYLILFITSRCNARCEFCFYWKAIEQNDKRTELSVEEMSRLASSFTHLVQLTITGGEPFLRTDLSDIVRVFVENSGVPMVTIPTNGSLTNRIESDMARMLSEHPYTRFNLSVSIDDIGEAHDTVRRLPGCFEAIRRTDRVLARLKERHHNLVTSACITMHPGNADHIEEIAREISDRFAFDYVELLLARGDTRTPEIRTVSAQDYIEAIEKIHALNREREYDNGIFIRALWRLMTRHLVRSVRDNQRSLPCVSLRKFVEIDSDGVVFPCETINTIHEDPEGRDFRLLDIREYDYDIRRALESQEAERIRRFIDSVKCHCSFECILLGNIVFTPRGYREVLREMFR